MCDISSPSRNTSHKHGLIPETKSCPPRQGTKYGRSPECKCGLKHVHICQTLGARQPCWRHQMETFSSLLALCAKNSSVTDEFPWQRPVTRNVDVFFDNWANNGDAVDLRRHCAHYDITVMIRLLLHITLRDMWCCLLDTDFKYSKIYRHQKRSGQVS